ncbi:hypothetical protein AQUSIP_20870 [Aquicella siphonis]|uniref:Uncharacterized protein n=1 Tax=Aquicella siphonis TaxID=254247 RepID=A0A5E4PK44_9COXI|nr:hypothetical protein [Aquicella siphonis]VVC76761.1 hypothetical protein AQUSIP_20870 [Aquicella siphonis]
MNMIKTNGVMFLLLFLPCMGFCLERNYNNAATANLYAHVAQSAKSAALHDFASNQKARYQVEQGQPPGFYLAGIGTSPSRQ